MRPCRSSQSYFQSDYEILDVLKIYRTYVAWDKSYALVTHIISSCIQADLPLVYSIRGRMNNRRFNSFLLLMSSYCRFYHRPGRHLKNILSGYDVFAGDHSCLQARVIWKDLEWRVTKVLMPKYFSKVFHPQPPREPGHGIKKCQKYLCWRSFMGGVRVKGGESTHAIGSHAHSFSGPLPIF